MKGKMQTERMNQTDIRKELPQRKHPPHQVPVVRHNAPVILFVTLTIQPRGDFLANAIIHNIFLQACADADSWHVGRYIIMPDHIHLFCAPARWPIVSVKRWSGYLKERVTKRINNQPLDEEMVEPARFKANARTWRWLPDCWDTQMRSGDHYREKWAYVRMNPVRLGLATRPEAWPWQGELNQLRW